MGSCFKASEAAHCARQAAGESALELKKKKLQGVQSKFGKSKQICEIKAKTTKIQNQTGPTSAFLISSSPPSTGCLFPFPPLNNVFPHRQWTGLVVELERGKVRSSIFILESSICAILKDLNFCSRVKNCK